MAVLTQLLINDVSNPFALVLVDVPSSAKTLTLDFFSGLPEIAYPTDEFTAASFVSHASNVAESKLKDIDLLPRIRHKMLIARDMASIFSDKQDVLEKQLGTLTRVLDGDGYQRESGVHGGRGYAGDYLFMMLAATTPLRQRIWEMMGSLGARLFFFNTRQPDPSENDLIAQISSISLPEKKKLCLEATNKLLQTLWRKYEDGIDWNKEADSEEHRRTIAKIAQLLASTRGVYKKDKKDGEPFILIEKASRLNQLLYNFIRGNAVSRGRTHITDEDIKECLIVAVESAPPQRALFIRHLLENGGEAKTIELEKALNVARQTIFNIGEKLKRLGVVTGKEILQPGFNEPAIFKLKDNFLPLTQYFTQGGRNNGSSF